MSESDGNPGPDVPHERTRNRDSEGTGPRPLTGKSRMSSSDERPIRERLRARAGFTHREWTIAISVLIFLPYPGFLYLAAFTSVDLTVLGIVSFAYSLVAIVLNFVL